MRRAGVLAAAAAVAAGGCGSAERHQPRGERLRPFPPSARVVPAVPRGPGTLTAYLPHGIELRRAPRGRVVSRLGAHTRFGSPLVLAVPRRRGNWAAVIAPEVPNGRVGWIDARVARLFRNPWTLTAHLAARRLVVRRAGRVVRRIVVGVGGRSSPTPVGRFGVTDKLVIGRASSYGCCVLALSGHQTNGPQDWGGGDRLAIHGTNDPATIGAAASLGCLHAGEADMKWLLRQIPLGTVLVIRR